MRNRPALIAALLLATTLGLNGLQSRGEPESHRSKEGCQECIARRKEVCTNERNACVLKARAADAALRPKCASDEKCAAAAKEALDQQIAACDEAALACDSVVAAGCPQCKEQSEAEACDACVSREERICGYREQARKALARAQYYIDLDHCAADDGRCVELSNKAYDDLAMAAVLEAQACALGSTDHCSRCRFPQPRRNRARRP